MVLPMLIQPVFEAVKGQGRDYMFWQGIPIIGYSVAEIIQWLLPFALLFVNLFWLAPSCGEMLSFEQLLFVQVFEII